jgi:DNA-binding response OmpR family regulator
MKLTWSGHSGTACVLTAIRALLRRSQFVSTADKRPQACNSSLTVGPLALNLHTCQVKVSDQTMQLTPIAFDLLHYLMTHPGEVFSSEQLLQRKWRNPPQTADPGLVRWHIKKRRAKIERDPDRPTYLRTIPHHGYLLDGSTCSREHEG